MYQQVDYADKFSPVDETLNSCIHSFCNTSIWFWSSPPRRPRMQEALTGPSSRQRMKILLQGGGNWCFTPNQQLRLYHTHCCKQMPHGEKQSAPDELNPRQPTLTVLGTGANRCTMDHPLLQRPHCRPVTYYDNSPIEAFCIQGQIIFLSSYLIHLKIFNYSP